VTTNSSNVVASTSGAFTCSAKSRTNETYRQVIRYGDELQKEVALSLYSGTNFLGSSTTVFVNGYNSSSTLSISSWHFTGNNSWAIYSGRNFTGTVRCLNPEYNVAAKGYGITFALNNAQISVGSVRYGCNNNGTGTTTTTPRSGYTTTKKSDSGTVFQKELCLLIMSLALIFLSFVSMDKHA